MVKERYLINEAAKEVHVESHVLRYWEEELELPIKRNEQGHRIYTQEDVERFIRIKNLKDQGLQLKAVRAVLEQIQEEKEGADAMRADNPFAQKQLTKIGKNGDMKVIQLKPSEDPKWKEFKNERHIVEGKEKKNNELAIQIKDMVSMEDRESHAQIQENQKEQLARLQYLFQKLIKEAVAESNEAMAEDLTARITDSVKADVCKELDYQFRLMEEREEQRHTAKQEQDKQRDEEYYKRIDELLRQYGAKKKTLLNSKTNKGNALKLFKAKEKTAKEESSDGKMTEAKTEKKLEKKAEKKPKREFHFLKRAVEIK